MNVENKDLIYKIQENKIKEGKRLRYYRRFFNSIERVFKLIRFVDKKYIRFNPSRNFFNFKFVNNEEWIVELNSNYCLIKILENLYNYCGLQVGNEQNIDKATRKN